MKDEKGPDSQPSLDNLVKELGHPKILHVDDEPRNLRLLVDILKEDKYIQYIASDGQDAFDQAKEKKPDLFRYTRVITYDDHPMLDYLQPPIYSVRQNAEEIAKISFEVMHGILEKNKSFDQELIKPKLILR